MNAKVWPFQKKEPEPEKPKVVEKRGIDFKDETYIEGFGDHLFGLEKDLDGGLKSIEEERKATEEMTKETVESYLPDWE